MRAAGRAGAADCPGSRRISGRRGSGRSHYCARASAPMPSSGDEPGGSEDLELARAVAQDRSREQLAAGEAERVAVARVAAGDPYALANLADDRDPVRRHAPDSRPAVRHVRAIADEALDEPVEAALDQVGRLLDVRLLGRERRVAVAADNEPSVGELVPVVVAVARVVRALVEALAQRLGRENLSADRLGREGGGERAGGAGAWHP